MPRRPRAKLAVDESLVERILDTIRQCPNPKGRYRMDISSLVWDTKSLYEDYPRPRVVEVHRVIELLLARGAIQVRMCLRTGGPVIITRSNKDGAEQHEQAANAQD